MDARRLQDRPLGGVGRQLANLVPHIAREVDLVLLTDRRRPAPTLPYDFRPLPGIGPAPEPAWLQISVRRWLRGFDGVFHGTFNAIPAGYRGPSVVTIHDLSWVEHPEDLSTRSRVSFAMQARWSVRTSSKIVAVSEYARQSIVRTYRVPAAKVTLAYPGVDPTFCPERAAGAARWLQANGISGPFVLALAGARRRGAEVAVAAWRQLDDGVRVPMVVVGETAGPRHPGLIYAGAVDDETWPGLLAGAAVFCYPTRYEGFGMPALEAAASGAPVVCAPIGPLPEVLGDAAEWCSAPTASAVATGLDRLLRDPERRAQLRQAGLDRAAAATTWEQSAATIVGAYHEAAK